MADVLGDCSRSQSPLSPPFPDGWEIFIFNAVVVSALLPRGGCEDTAPPLSIPTPCPCHRQLHTHSAKFAICLTASTAPGRGSSSMKKFLDSQMLMAFSCEGKASSYCTSCNFSCMCILLTFCQDRGWDREQWDHQLQSSPAHLPCLCRCLCSPPTNLHPSHTIHIGDALEQAWFCLCSPRHRGSCTFL